MLLALFAARAHCWLMFVLLSTKGRRIFSAELLISQSVSRQPVLLPGALPYQLQDFIFVLAKFHNVPVGTFLQPVKVSLNGRAAFKHIE